MACAESMLVIRSSQLAVLGRLGWKSFESEMWAHLREHFPIDCDLMGEVQAREVIRYGIERADAHGFTTRSQMRRYIDLSLSLGTDFDRDPQLPWAAQILAQGGDNTMDVLHARAITYLALVTGEDGGRYRRAMMRVRGLTFERAVEATSSGPLNVAVYQWLGHLYPEKLANLDDDALGAFFALGGEEAARHGLTSPAGVLILMTVLFMLGSHAARDPQIPWMGATLRDEEIADPDAKARALLDGAMSHLNRAVALLRAKED